MGPPSAAPLGGVDRPAPVDPGCTQRTSPRPPLESRSLDRLLVHVPVGEPRGAAPGRRRTPAPPGEREWTRRYGGLGRPRPTLGRKVLARRHRARVFVGRVCREEVRLDAGVPAPLRGVGIEFGCTETKRSARRAWPSPAGGRHEEDVPASRQDGLSAEGAHARTDAAGDVERHVLLLLAMQRDRAPSRSPLAGIDHYGEGRIVRGRRSGAPRASHGHVARAFIRGGWRRPVDGGGRVRRCSYSGTLR